MFDFDKIYQVMFCVIMWICFINVIYGVSDIIGWILQLVVDFGFVQVFEVKRVQVWKQMSVFLFFVEFVIIYVIFKEYMKELF